MAILFPFDESLVGHTEIVSIRTADLTLPFIVFPKGSFFVNGTYGIIKGTNNILRPGIDYRVMSCNETISFSPDPIIDEKIRQCYVRNAILLRTNTDLEIEWRVAYCGGEDESKAAEYTNYLHTLHNAALTDGTVTGFTTPHQGWANFVNKDNTQITQGKYIYATPFRQIEEKAIGGGLGWGKVELALQAIADTVSNGNDPLIMQAFYDWITHHELEIDKKLNEFKNITIERIDTLDDKRVDIDQYIFSNLGTTSPKHKYVEHRNVILRGIDPTTPGESLVGLHGLATDGRSKVLHSTHLLQRKDPNYVYPFGRIAVKLHPVSADDKYNIKYTIGVGVAPPQTDGWHLVAISAEQGKIADIAITPPTTIGTYEGSFIYPKNKTASTVDVVFAYLIRNNDSDFSGVDVVMIEVQDSDDYTLEIISNHNITTEDGTIKNVGVKVNKRPGVSDKPLSLDLLDASGVSIGTASPNAVVWATGANSVILPNVILTTQSSFKDSMFYLALRDADIVYARIPMFSHPNTGDLEVSLLQANEMGIPNAKGNYLLVSVAKDMVGSTALKSYLELLRYNDGVVTKQLPIDGMTTSPSNADAYIIPLHFEDYPIGTVIKIWHLRDTSNVINVITTADGLEEYTNGDNVEVSIRSFIRDVNTRTYYELVFVATTPSSPGILPVMVNGDEYNLNFTTSFARLLIPVIAGETTATIKIGTKPEVVLDLPKYVAYLQTRTGDILSLAEKDIAKYSDVDIMVGILNLSTETILVQASGDIKDTAIFAGAAKFITDFAKFSDLVDNNPTITFIVGGIPVTKPFIGANLDDYLIYKAMPRALVINEKTGRSTFRDNELNEFNGWVELKDISYDEIVSVSANIAANKATLSPTQYKVDGSLMSLDFQLLLNTVTTPVMIIAITTKKNGVTTETNKICFLTRIE